MEFLNVIFYAFLRPRCLDVDTNQGSQRPAPVVC